MVTLSRIEKHPAKDGFMLYCRATAIPPYFGTRRQCLEAQKHFEAKLHQVFDNLPKDRQDEILKEL